MRGHQYGFAIKSPYYGPGADILVWTINYNKADTIYAYQKTLTGNAIEYPYNREEWRRLYRQGFRCIRVKIEAAK